jgi:hypothetical protein
MMNLKKISLLGASCLAFMAAWSSNDAAAMPIYARQTGQSCSACHFQRFPLLNAYGRTFKVGGYTQKGTQPTIEDTNLSLPSTLNATFLSKFRYQKTNGTAVNSLTRGEFQIPDEATLYVGGRLAKDIGVQSEIGLNGTAKLIGMKVPFVLRPSDAVTVNVVPFFTDAQGPSYGFELLNTGALRFMRTFENRTQTSAQQYIGTASAATGLALVAHHKYGYFSYTPYLIHDAATDPGFSSGKYLNYIRCVVTPEKVHNFDIAGGVQIWTGTSTVTVGTTETSNHVSAWAVDAQAQGKVGEMPLGVYLTYGNSGKSVAGSTPNAYNSSLISDKSAFAVATELGVLPSQLSIGLGLRVGKNGSDKSDNAITLGSNYQLAKNMVFQLNHSIGSGDAVSSAAGGNTTTLMLYSAF